MPRPTPLHALVRVAEGRVCAEAPHATTRCLAVPLTRSPRPRALTGVLTLAAWVQAASSGCTRPLRGPRCRCVVTLPRTSRLCWTTVAFTASESTCHMGRHSAMRWACRHGVWGRLGERSRPNGACLTRCRSIAARGVGESRTLPHSACTASSCTGRGCRSVLMSWPPWPPWPPLN